MIRDAQALRSYRARLTACEVCGRPEVVVHHLIRRSLVHLDVPFNLLGLCEACHTGPQGFHAIPTARGRWQWYRRSRHGMTWETRRRVGWVLFFVLPWVKQLKTLRVIG